MSKYSTVREERPGDRIRPAPRNAWLTTTPLPRNAQSATQPGQMMQTQPSQTLNHEPQQMQ
jgi:hypothetical protein